MAVFLVRRTKRLAQFAFFKQGADHQVDRENSPGDQGNIGEPWQRPEKGNPAAVPGVANQAQDAIGAQGRLPGLWLAGAIVPPLAKAKKQGKIVSAQSTDEHDRRVQEEQPLQRRNQACRQNDLLLGKTSGIPEQGEQAEPAAEAK